MTVQPTAAAKPAAQPAVSDADLRNFIRANYPDLAGFLDHKELGPLLLKAARGKWDAAKLQGQIARTNWWKNTQQTARAWDALQITDPATARARRLQTEGEVSRLARQLGVEVDARQVADLATRVNRLGWTVDQVRESLAARFTIRPDETSPGAGETTVGGLRSLASAYGLTVGDPALTEWTRQILSGTRSPDDFRTYLVGLAKGSYTNNAAMQAALDSGQTVRQIADPLFQQAAGLLGLDPNRIDINDARWKRLLNTYDPASKEYRMMTPDEARRTVMTDSAYGFDKTRTGRQYGADFVQQITRAMGWSG